MPRVLRYQGQLLDRISWSSLSRYPKMSSNTKTRHVVIFAIYHEKTSFRVIDEQTRIPNHFTVPYEVTATTTNFRVYLRKVYRTKFRKAKRRRTRNNGDYRSGHVFRIVDELRADRTPIGSLNCDLDSPAVRTRGGTERLAASTVASPPQ